MTSLMFVALIVGAVVIVLTSACWAMYRVLCSDLKLITEYRDLVKFITDNHETMPNALLKEVNKFR